MPERTEYRVVRSDGLPGKAFEVSLADMEAHRKSLEDEDGRTHRIQQRTVFETPWEDVEQGEEGGVSCSIPNCIACRQEEPRPRAHRRDIVQVQKDAWKRIAQEEREGKRRPEVARWVDLQGEDGDG